MTIFSYILLVLVAISVLLLVWTIALYLIKWFGKGIVFMKGLFQRLFSKKEKESKDSEKSGRCPVCNNNHFYAGPEGGMSQDVLCTRCFTEFCVSPFGMDNMGQCSLDRILRVYGVPLDRIQNDNPGLYIKVYAQDAARIAIEMSETAAKKAVDQKSPILEAAEKQDAYQKSSKAKPASTRIRKVTNVIEEGN